MKSSRRVVSTGDRLATLGLLAAAAALAALGLAWWRDAAHHYASPSWDATRFIALSPAADRVRERWLVVVNLRCPHCRAHLLSLAQRLEGRANPPSLAALIVDQHARPVRLDLGVPLPGGVWWDSAAVWREAWGRRVYGETFRFDARGRLLSATPQGTLPDSGSSRM